MPSSVTIGRLADQITFLLSCPGVVAIASALGTEDQGSNPARVYGILGKTFQRSIVIFVSFMYGEKNALMIFKTKKILYVEILYKIICIIL
jgi:hypothetical protein